jgi:DNA invertase Pin-like site-specific DNA recombinase
VAELFAIRTTPIAHWAGGAFRTPDAPRSRRSIRRLSTEAAKDAARLYDQGWSIRQVAKRFDCDYNAMRRTLGKHVKRRSEIDEQDRR